MQLSTIDTDLKRKLRIVLSILFIEYLTILASGISFTNLKGNSLFSIGVDPFLWILYLTKIPQTILNNYWLAILCDTTIVLGFIFLIINPFKNKIALVLFCLMLVFYITYMGVIGSRNYMTGFFLVLIPFLFSTNKNRQISFESLRYFLLFFYFSAKKKCTNKCNLTNSCDIHDEPICKMKE